MDHSLVNLIVIAIALALFALASLAAGEESRPGFDGQASLDRPR
jgi:hypothetical protein